MWTPRRLGLLLLGLLLFGGAFTVYAKLLGAIDGLPPLPEAYLERRPVNRDEPVAPVSRTQIVAKLQQAFPGPCPEKDYFIQLELGKRGIVLAAHQLQFEDGKARLSPFSLATFHDRPGLPPEINTVHADVAVLVFDQPVRSLPDMAKARIVGCTLLSTPNAVAGDPADHDPRRNRVTITNNRGTPTPTDDYLVVTPGPVYYHEAEEPNAPLDRAKPQLWTAAAVQLTDLRDAPKSTVITAQGMQLFLTSEEPAKPKPGQPVPVAKAKPKQAQGSLGGVRRLVLPENVRMNLWMEPGNGFLAAGDTKPKADAKPDAKPAEKTNLQIVTQGPFFYDVGETADRARFERKPSEGSPLPDRVHVRRPTPRPGGGEDTDTLECEFLELQFAHQAKDAKPAPAPAAPAPAKAGGAPQQSIEWIHAWGSTVVLTSDAENLHAHGTDLLHDAKLKRTTLKGSPDMDAAKDGSLIHAPELVMYGTDSPEGQQAIAKGRGFFQTLDRQPVPVADEPQPANAGPRTVQARWTDQMVYRKVDGVEQIVLTGDAEFDDHERGQRMRADLLKLFLAPADPNAPKPEPGEKADTNPGSRKPQRLEALGHVSAKGPELNVHDTDQLIVLFKDGPPQVPGSGPRMNAPLVPVPAGSDGPAAFAGPVGEPAAGTPPGPAGAPAVATAAPPKPPIDLTARNVQVFAVRAGDKTLLDVVHCEGRVRVHQDPAPPQTKPVDMRGQALHLTHHPDGSRLVVTGDAAAPAEVHLPDLSLLGPSVTIDQRENIAEVLGVGSMRILSQTDLQGKKLAKPTDMTVVWDREMRFNGTQARFVGKVQAEQEAMRVLCHTMDVYMNRPVSLAQPNGGRGDQGGTGPANVERVVCDMAGAPTPGPVRFDEKIVTDGRLARYQRLESKELVMVREDGLLDAPGPGNVRILQPGAKNAAPGAALAPPPKRPGAGQLVNREKPPPEQEMKLTWVKFEGKMIGANKTKTATFLKNVEVIHMPSDDPGLHTDFAAVVNKLPPGAMHLRCETLKVLTRDAGPDGKSTHEMDAIDRATMASNEFQGEADRIKYDEAKRVVTFEGTTGSPARLYKLLGVGVQPQAIKARVIRYYLDTRNHDTIDTHSIESGG